MTKQKKVVAGILCFSILWIGGMFAGKVLFPPPEPDCSYPFTAPNSFPDCVEKVLLKKLNAVPSWKRVQIIVVSVSSDGRYALTTDLYQHADSYSGNHRP